MRIIKRLTLWPSQPRTAKVVNKDHVSKAYWKVKSYYSEKTIKIDVVGDELSMYYWGKVETIWKKSFCRKRVSTESISELGKDNIVDRTT